MPHNDVNGYLRRLIIRLKNIVIVPAIVYSLTSFDSLADANDFVLTGTVVTPHNVISDGAISISGHTIEAVGLRSAISYVKYVTVKTGGVVLPGFIDLHNHLTWNVLPRWIPSSEIYQPIRMAGDSRI